jgi:hypothetical protein
VSEPSSTRRRSRIFIRKMLGFNTWREFERELRRRRPIEAHGVEVVEAEHSEGAPATREEDES